jgi:anti-sigma regulatory factor (Ser/Thr protein kinase)
MEPALMNAQATLTLPPSAGSIRAARQHVSRTLEDGVPSGVVDDAVLLVSELATNAVVHARTRFTVIVGVGSECVRIEVHDGSPSRPVARNPEPLAPNGRGLQIVGNTADRWGTDALLSGKSVWFELDHA